MRRLLLALVCAILSLVPFRAIADEPPLVMVLVEPGGDVLASRVEAELHALGFDVKTGAAETGASDLEGVARASHAAAAIRIVRSDNKAQVWVADRVTGKTLLRELEVKEGEDPNGVLAVRAVELLRASLLEVEASHPSRGEVKPTEVVRQVVASSRPAPPPAQRSTLAVLLGVGPQLMPGLSASLHAMVGMAWAPSRLGLEAAVLIPILPSQVCAPQGCSRVTSGLLTGGLRVALAPEGARVHPELGAGFAGGFLHADGDPVSPYQAATSNIFVAAAYARFGVSLTLSRYFRVGLDALVGSALPPTPIRFGGQEVAHWGGPFVSILARTEIWLP